MRTTWSIVKRTYAAFLEDSVMRLSAALAFYTSLSMAPLVVIVLAVLGSFYGAETARDAILHEVSRLVGASGAHLLQEVIARSDLQHRSGLAALIGAGALLLASTTVFASLQDALNVIWHVKPAPGRGSDVLAFLRKRLLSLGAVLGIVVMMVASLLASASLSFLQREGRRLDLDSAGLWHSLDTGLNLVLFTLAFAAVFKWLPDVKIQWRHVWPGAAVTSLLFAGGRELIGLYLAHRAVGSAYGAAGSLFFVLLWTYYSAIILLAGVEVTRSWVLRRGVIVEPADHAVSTDAPRPRPRERR